MMETPFRFGLERVRELRAHDEERAKEQFAASLSQRVRGEALLRAADERLRTARADSGAPQGLTVDAATLVSRQAWVERLERSKADAELRLRSYDAELEARRVTLTDASRNREVLDRLRERQHEAPGQERNESLSQRRGRRRAEGRRRHDRYLTASAILKIGRYMAIRIVPIVPPRNTIMSGSSIEVSAATAASTSSS